MIKFDWDLAKAIANRKKHRVSFEEAQSVFYDDFGLLFFDESHSENEDRFILLGLSDQRRLLMVCHCESQQGGLVRIISARKATNHEAKFYSGV